MKGKNSLMSFQMTSDEFFERYSPKTLLGREVELAFIDGMHLIEFLLRDFANTEAHCRYDSKIVLHDCVPTDTSIAERVDDSSRRTVHPDWWAGDVWKILPILRIYRPDLKVDVIDAPPTGLVVVSNLNPASTTIIDNLSVILQEWVPMELATYGLERFIREAKISTTAGYLSSL
jgi:hypothetical protein